MKTVPPLLYPSVIARLPLHGQHIMRDLIDRARTVNAETKDMVDPAISVLIRTRNNERFISGLLADIKAQVYEGDIDIVVVDTESTDQTIAIARKAGARIITISQADFTYPRALNLGMAAAKADYVVSLSGHSNLSNRYMFKSLTRWAQEPNFAGIYSTPLCNWNASRTERWILGFGLGKRFRTPEIVTADRMGLLGANGSIISKTVWKEFGGYDERYAGGGEDAALGRDLLAAGYLLVHEPLCAVLHSHHVGLINGARQYLHWRRVARPEPFDRERILRRRPDLRD